MVKQDKQQAARNEIARASLQELQGILKKEKGRHFTSRETAAIGHGLVRMFSLFSDIEERQEVGIGNKM